MALSRRTLLRSSLAAPAIIALPSLPQAQESARTVADAAQSARFRVGDIEVFALSDGYLDVSTQLLIGFDPGAAEEAARAAYHRYDGEATRLGVNGFVLRTGDRVIAVDCGTPGLVADTVGAWHASLAQLGIAPEEIDTIFQTHLHMDHTGGLGQVGAGNRLLPNAQMIVSEAEWEFTHSEDAYAAAPDMIRTSFDLARGLIVPYASDARMLPMDRETEIAPGVVAVPLPGHTPGHMGLRVSSGAETLLIWGDAMHFQAFQFAHPDWSIAFDADPVVASETRARLFDMAAADRLRIAGAHLDFPSFGYVETAGEAYRFIPAGVDYG